MDQSTSPLALMVSGLRGYGRRWRSNPSGKCSQERLTQGAATSTMPMAANPSGCARCGAGAGCSAIKYQSLRGLSGSIRVKLGTSQNTFRRRWTLNLYWMSCSKTYNDVPRSARIELGYGLVNLALGVDGVGGLVRVGE